MDEDAYGEDEAAFVAPRPPNLRVTVVVVLVRRARGKARALYHFGCYTGAMAHEDHAFAATVAAGSDQTVRDD